MPSSSPDGDDRLGILSQLDVLEADPAEVLDRITHLARLIFDVESATVNLVADGREWFKAASGVVLDDPDRGTALGAYVILDASVVVAEDTTRDERFADNPLVDTEKTPRFFAGAPLVVNDGHRVGALCLSDNRPRTFGEADRKMLALLADIASDTLETRRHAHQIDYLISALEEIEESVVITEADPIDDAGPRIVWVNEAFTDLTGYARSQLIGERLGVLVGPQTDENTLARVWGALRAGEPIQVEAVNYRSNGTPYVAAWNVAPVRSEEGRVSHWVSIQRDVTDQKRREEQLAYEASHDGLTELYNRTALERIVEDERARDRLGSPLRALMYLDLDNFKAVNDNLGHNRGDELLIRTARALESAVRSDDVVARVGGDEFAVYLSSLDDPSTAPIIAERIHNAVETTLKENGCEIPIRLSLGMVTGLPSFDSFEDILRGADTAMYEAKETGRRTVVHEAAQAK